MFWFWYIFVKLYSIASLKYDSEKQCVIIIIITYIVIKKLVFVWLNQ